MEKLTSAMWDEFMELPLTDAEPELSGFVSALPPRADGDLESVDTRRLPVARRMLKLCRSLGLAEGGVSLDKRRGRAIFRVPPELRSGGFGSHGKKWAWFRGVWGGCGSLYSPRSGYYMALRAPSAMGRGGILAALRSASVSPGVREKGGRTEFMIRDVERVVTVLARMGLVRTSLLLEETAVIRSVRGMANKMVNCDAANIASTLAAARAQMAVVDAIDENGLWGELPPRLAEIARLRRENPSASLRELGQILPRPVSKSTVEYRWKKLVSAVGEKI
jgi:DNA-binding protein WhiA